MINKKFEFENIVENICKEINLLSDISKNVHTAGNIKESGNVVESVIREKISSFLPDKYLVKQGHIINSEGMVSPQFDIIIFDRLTTPRFFESKNETVFFPIESVLAVGEIKRTLQRGGSDEFSKKIKFLKDDMKRELIDNPVFGGGIKANATFSDIAYMRTDIKYKNSLFPFIIAINFNKEGKLNFKSNIKFLPSDICILNWGYYVYGSMENSNIRMCNNDEEPNINSMLSMKANNIFCLSHLLSRIINHLNNCQVEPFGVSRYIKNKTLRKGDIEEIKLGQETR